MPWSLIDSDSWTSASSSKSCRGWCGFGEISSVGISRSSGLASPPSSVTARIAARPRPIPRLRSATGRDLLGQLEIRLGPGAVGIEVDHRLAEARGLADAHVARDHRVEHQLGEVRPYLGLDLLGQARATVVHGEEHPGDREPGVEL